MTHRMHWAIIASLGAAALTFAADETYARSGGAPGGAHGGGVAAGHSIARAPGVHAFRHHRRNFVGPAIGGFYYGPDGTYYGPDGTPLADGPQSQPASNDVRYTYTYDVPWDWAHRFPPNVAPSDRPYVSSCGAETVTVPGRGGGEQTVNITRCY